MNHKDYFAEKLLAKLDAQEPLVAAYEAQSLSRKVGFDFSNIEQALERALDEVREVKEAFDEGKAGKAHFGDEIADLAFSLVNLVRHKGVPLDKLPTVASLTQVTVENIDAHEASDSVALDMSKIADNETSNEKALAIYVSALQKCATLAYSYGFKIDDLLKANVQKYLLRCAAIETLASEDGKSWRDLADAGEIIDYWKRAKRIL
jgi:hypothetical protein